MAFSKIERTNEDITRVMSSVIGEIKDPRISGNMITVTGADTTQDLKYCKVYISVLGEFNEKDLFKGLKSANGFIRHQMAVKLNLRQTPEFKFILDKSIQYGAHISSVLATLDIKPEEPDMPENEEDNDPDND